MSFVDNGIAVRYKQVRDVIYNYIPLCPLAIKIIDTPYFQALRELRQLGVVVYVFPSANGTRFEHSLQVYHLTGLVLKQLQNNQPSLGITERQITLFQIAGLTHDIGHCACSHTFDCTVAPILGIKKQKHELRSISLFRFLVTSYQLDVTEEEINLICAIITGIPLPNYPAWYFQIVANQMFEFDTDKCCYLQLDLYYLGIQSSLQINRIYSQARIIDNQLTFHEKCYHLLWNCFHTRYELFRDVYRHPVVISIELIMTDILILMGKAQRWKKFFECPLQSWRLCITDHIIHTLPMLIYNSNLSSKRLELLVQAEKLRLSLQLRSIYKRTTENNTLSIHRKVNVTLGFTNQLKEENPMNKIWFFKPQKLFGQTLVFPTSINDCFHLRPEDVSPCQSNIVTEERSFSFVAPPPLADFICS